MAFLEYNLRQIKGKSIARRGVKILKVRFFKQENAHQGLFGQIWMKHDLLVISKEILYA